MTRSALNFHALSALPPSCEGRAARPLPQTRVVRALSLAGFLAALLAGDGGSKVWAAAAPAQAGSGPASRTSATPSTAMHNAPTAAAIQSITLEIEAHGRPGGLRLVLRRDGSAEATTPGQARHGTSDRVTRAPLPAAEFQALAQSLLDEGFFAMAERYEPEGLADGAWAQLTVQHAGGQHQVFQREAAGPAGLQRLQAAMLALQARLRFTPAVP